MKKIYNVTDKIANGIIKLGNKLKQLGKAKLLIETKTESGITYEYMYERVTEEEAIALLSNCPGQKLISYNDKIINKKEI